jgi:predicted HTH domain antitoxin
MSTSELKIDLPVNISEDEIKLLLAIKLYEVGKLSLGQAAQLAGFSKRSFIDVLGQHHVPVLNYSADDLREEIGV